MFKSSFATGLVILSTTAAICSANNGAGRVPVLLELFTSEGCSSCPPADNLPQALDEQQPVAGAELIVLSEHVDYWNNLGWKGPFSSPQYTIRQQDYTARNHFDDVYTPQLVVDGQYAVVGSDGRKVSAVVQKAIRDSKVPITISSLARNGNEVTARIEIPADQELSGRRGMLYVALADEKQETHVAGGENRGRLLVHVAVTRVLKQVGKIDFDVASTKAVTLQVQEGPANGLKLVAFIQDPKSGHVLGAVQQKL